MRAKRIAALFAALGLLAAVCPLTAFAAGIKDTASYKVTQTASGVTLNVVISDPAAANKPIQAALTAARDNATDAVPYTVVVPAGTYGLAKHLNIYSNTTLVTAGVTLEKCYPDGGVMIRLGISAEENSGYDGYRNVTLRGGVYDGNADDPVYGVGHTNAFTPMHFAHVTNLTVKNVTICNSYGAHQLEIGAADNVSVTGCTFKDHYIKQDDVGEESASGQEALQLDIACKDVASSFPIYDGTVCRNVLVKNCTFSNLFRGVGSHSAVLGRYMTNVEISQNTFTDIKAEAVIATAFQHSRITNNTFKRVGIGINFMYYRNLHTTGGISAQGVDTVDCDTVISGNTIGVYLSPYVVPCAIRSYGYKLTNPSNKEGNSFIYSLGEPEDKVALPVADYRVNGLIVMTNTITTPRYGIRLFRTFSGTVMGNDLTCTGTAEGNGVELVGSEHNTVVNNAIRKFPGYGIYGRDSSKDNLLAENTVENTGLDGICVSGGDAVIHTNTVSKTGGAGILCFASGTVSGNTVSSPKGDGISLANGSVTVSQNTVTSAAGRGIAFAQTGSGTSAVGNTVTGAGKEGVSVSGGSADVRDNTVTGNRSGAAVLYTAGAAGTASDNRITKAAGDGIRFDAASGTASLNTVRTAGGDGVAAYKGKIKVTRNEIAAVRRGVYLSGALTGSAVSGNTVTSVTGAGIYLTGSAAAVKGNTVEDNASGPAVGLYENSSGTVSGNVLLSSIGSGIYLSDSTGTVTNNTVNTPKAYGIAVLGKTAQVTKNTVSDTGKQGIYLRKTEKTAAVSGNTVSRTGLGGICVTGGAGSVSGNTVTDAAGNGVTFDKAAGSAVSNTVRRAKKNAVYVTGNTVAVTDNVLTSPKANGIFVSGAKAKVLRNTVTGAGQKGIRLGQTQSGSKVTDNTVKKSVKGGIYLSQSAAAVTGNTVTTVTDGMGIVCYGSAGTVVRNTVTSASANGIYLSGSVMRTTDNAVQKSGKNGISLYRANGVVLRRNEVDGSQKYGIYLTQSKALTVENNVVSDAGSGIVAAKTAAGVLIANKVRDVTGDAIALRDSARFAHTETPAAPVMQSVTAVPGGVTVTFEAVPKVTGYLILRRSGTADYTAVATVKRAGAYTDTSAVPGTVYEYSVRAYRTGTSCRVRGFAAPGAAVKAA